MFTHNYKSHNCRAMLHEIISGCLTSNSFTSASLEACRTAISCDGCIIYVVEHLTLTKCIVFAACFWFGFIWFASKLHSAPKSNINNTLISSGSVIINQTACTRSRRSNIILLIEDQPIAAINNTMKCMNTSCGIHKPTSHYIHDKPKLDIHTTPLPSFPVVILVNHGVSSMLDLIG